MGRGVYARENVAEPESDEQRLLEAPGGSGSSATRCLKAFWSSEKSQHSLPVRGRCEEAAKAKNQLVINCREKAESSEDGRPGRRGGSILCGRAK